jgi:hypothetical protein
MLPAEEDRPSREITIVSSRCWCLFSVAVVHNGLLHSVEAYVLDNEAVQRVCLKEDVAMFRARTYVTSR